MHGYDIDLIDNGEVSLVMVGEFPGNATAPRRRVSGRRFMKDDEIRKNPAGHNPAGLSQLGGYFSFSR